MLRTIQLEDYNIVEKIRRQYGHELCSHAFVSLYLWKDQMKLRLLTETDFFAVKWEEDGDQTWFYPCGSEAQQIKFIRAEGRKQGCCLTYMRDQDKLFLEQHFPEEYTYYEIPEYSEYVYKKDDLAQMKGQIYVNIRKQIHRFEREHQIEIVPLSKQNENLAREAMARFQEQDGEHGDGVELRALNQWKELGFIGIVILVDGIAECVVLGFPLTENIIDGCVEIKAGNQYGLSAYAQRALLLSTEFAYMNAEEDLGIEGLRRKKMHMVPAYKNRIWKAVYKGIQ